MILASLFCALLAAAPPDEAPVSGDCSADPAALVAEAAALLAASGPEPSAEALSAARRLIRSARRADASPDLALEAADLAFAAGDPEEGGDLLAAAADAGPARLSPAELLLLGRRAVERRRWREAIARYRELAKSLAAREQAADWIPRRVRELELEEEAEAIAVPSSGPSVEARLALADGKRALAAGRLREAREGLRTALQLEPSYVEALLALAALEARAGRSGAALKACREALAIEPERVETLTLLANLLWAEPDRVAKEESLVMLDRAVLLRPDLRSLLRLSANRWAEYGDASKAQERLDRYLTRATAKERDDTAALREALLRRTKAPETSPTPAAPPFDEPASAAIDLWRKAQVYAARGDAASLAAALALLDEAERLDPAFAQAPALAAAIHERRSEWKDAEEALHRAVRADPTRSTTYETLARVLERDPARAGEAAAAWIQAEQAGSTEALFHLASSAERAGRDADALGLYRRYRDEAPAGLNAADADAAIQRLDRRRSIGVLIVALAFGLLLCGVAVALYRAKTGLTFEEWLSENPGRAPEARRIVGRLRHEALKHGGLLLADGADRIETGEAATRQATAELLVARLYGGEGSRGLVAEAEDALTALSALARADGARLNLRHLDPVFSSLLRGVRGLRRARRSLGRVARSGSSQPIHARLAARLLRSAAQSFQLASGAEIERSVDRALALPVRLDALRALLARIAVESDRTVPTLETTGEDLPTVRICASDWETLWRNLFGNALSAGRLALSAAKRRDAVTGEARLTIVLADDIPRALTADEVRARTPDRGLGVVVEILRRNEGTIDVIAAPAAGFTKGIRIELPIVESA